MRNIFCIKYCAKRLFCSNAINIEMKYLNVAEKHDAAKTISGFLSRGSARRREGLSVYNKIFDFETQVFGRNAKMVMTSVSGHLLNYEFLLSYKSWQNCDPQQLFDAPIRKSCTEDGEKIRKTLEREIKSCQGLIVWTDCDREGENIGFEIIQVCKAIKPNITVYRAKFSEITANAVRRALANLTQPDQKQSDAVDVRQELDLRTGAAFTRFQTMRLQRNFPEQIKDRLISYGSCQIPTLGFVARRYKEAEEFVSEPFWKLKVTHTIDELTVEFNWDRNRLFDKDACEDYLLLCLTDPTATVVSVVTKPKNKWRPCPMDTVELEKLGSRKLKLPAKEVMTIAEKLYTRGIISYPRTETTIFSKEINLRSLVEQQTAHPQWGEFASRVLEWGPNPRNGNKSDQAHPPIHPTKFVTGLTGNENRVYELIVRHFLACISKDGVGSETIVNITIAGEKFHANGLCIYEKNYLDVYIYEKWNAKQIHRYENGQTFEPTEISVQEGCTTAPPLLTEADLIALMEKHGIGTDATHAEHIHKIKERGYIGEGERGFLLPGHIGMGLYEGYDAMQLSLAYPDLRAEFENDLKKICTGEKNPKDVLKDQIIKYKEAYKTFTEKVRALDENVGRRIGGSFQQTNETNSDNTEIPITTTTDNDNDTNIIPTNRIEEMFKCPKCKQASLALRRKKDSNGFYLGCLNFPECRNSVWFSDDISDITLADDCCSICGPGYRKMRVKFKRNYFLGVLGATSNVYTTCIGCDSHFREVFDINVECVKNVGRIVANQNQPRENVRSNSNFNNEQQRSNTVTNSNLSSNTLTTQSRNFTTATVDSTTINQNFNSENHNINNSRLHRNNQINRWNNLEEEQFFNDNNDDIFVDDEFDDLLINENLNEENPERNQNVGSNNNRTRNFDNNFISSPRRTNNDGFSNFPISNPVADIPWGRQAASSSITNIVKCSGCHNPAKKFTVKNNGPNMGRTFYKCPKEHGQCKYFEWADEVNQNNENSTTNRNGSNSTSNSNNRNSLNMNVSGNIVLCTGCQKPAREAITKKDGPNKGRKFYTCPESRCNFFQWADNNEYHSGQGIPWGSSNGNNSTYSNNIQSNRNDAGASTSRGTSSRATETRKRRCGICRQEGHTKIKCPRRDDIFL